MFINDDPEFIFLLVPKTATRSVLVYCKKEFPNGRQKGGHRASAIPEGLEHYPVVCVVRNPYDRMCSAWWSTCKRDNGTKYQHYLDRMKFLKLPNTLLGFLQLVEQLKTDKNHIITRQQVWYTDTFEVNHILRFEALLEDFRALPFIPNDAELPHANVTMTARPNWKELVGPQEAELINRIYARDFKKFKYEKL